MKKTILYTSINYWEKDAVEQLKQQQKELQEYCEKNQIKIICIYNERSDVTQRFVLSVLIDHIKSGSIKPDLMLYTSTDIFLADLPTALGMHRKLKDLGVTAQAIKESNIIISAP